MEDLHYDRICRTSRSESYLISQGDEPIARVELHYAHSVVYGLLVIEKGVDQIGEQQIAELRNHIDMDLVETADMPREDFILTIYYGSEFGTYHDPVEGDEANLDEGKGQSAP